MTLSITIELTDNDLDHFQEVLRRAQEQAGKISAKEITDSARKLLEEASKVQVPDFISSRLAKLESLINMVHDEGWGMSDEDKNRVLTALIYFADPKDVIPDTVPVVGYLDDAIMVELCVRELKHEVEAYEDFCSFRENEAQGRGIEAGRVGRADWLEGRREELHERMRRRRGREGAYSSRAGSPGYFRFG